MFYVTFMLSSSVWYWCIYKVVREAPIYILQVKEAAGLVRRCHVSLEGIDDVIDCNKMRSMKVNLLVTLDVVDVKPR